MIDTPNQSSTGSLKRALGLVHVVLYGLGVTIGAGIYVLIGATASNAGIYAPVAFCIAALVMAPTGASFAELTSRMPVSAGEAAFVKEGLRSNFLSLCIGLLVATSGIVSAAAVSIGAAGYIGIFLTAPQWLIVLVVVILMGAAAAWGIVESVSIAALLTLIEIGGLLIIVGACFAVNPDIAVRIPETIPHGLGLDVWSGIFAGGLLAFFAFIGFEDLVNIAEEVKKPLKVLPWAIFLTLTISTLLYVLVASAAVLSVPIPELAESKAPLGFVYEHVTGRSPVFVSAIAIFATLNGVIVQMIMASRVLYGLSRQGDLPAFFGNINPFTRTPLLTTAIVTAVILVLALAFPIESLAQMTSRFTLVVFILVNVALLAIKWRGTPAPEKSFQVGIWVPAAGLILSLGLLVIGGLY